MKINQTRFIIISLSTVLVILNNLFAQTTITYSESFIQGQSYNSSSSQWINWSNFIDQLSPRTYASVTIKGSNDPVGVSVTDATIASAIANALFTNTPGSWSTGGRTWRVGNCGSGIELSSGSTGLCACGVAYTLRPQIGNSNWGGVNSVACGSSSQTMTVIFESGTDVTHTFNYTGSVQSFTIPSGVTSVEIEAWGGQGASTSYSGGLGGYATGNLAVTPGETLNLYVGGQGGIYAVGDRGSWTAGGWNGGGLGYRSGRGGGGASDVRKGGTAIANRVIVAGGGGGASDASQCYGGSGGGTTGSYGLHSNASDPAFCGQGGTQIAGGAACINYGSAAAGGLGQGGNGGTSGNYDGTGGGGGYYGGGGGDQGGAGGGSSFIGGVTSASTISGQRSGNGQINIIYQSYTNDQTYAYSGSPQTWVVPAGVTTVTIEAWGAQGWSGTNSGGFGGYAKGDLSVTPGQMLNIYVGGQGTTAVGDAIPSGGGWNGGGNGQTNASANSAGGGGGSSDVRYEGSALVNRVIVAAGGGGSTNSTGSSGGNGGGLAGSSGDGSYSPGTGGTQLAGGNTDGALGQGGNATTGMTPWNGGGGGGYYGGGVSTAYGPGGGGSSYTGGLSNSANTEGVRSGNGLVVITYTLITTTSPNSPTIVYGTQSVDLTATVTPNPGGGSVEFFIDGSMIGFASVDEGTGIATLSYSTSTLTVGSYIIRADFSGYIGSPASSSNPSSNGTLTITSPGFNWEGDISTNWNTPGNWNTNAVPAAGNNVNILSDVPRWPHVTSDPTSPALCNTLSIASGALLTIDAGKALTVSGTINNSAGSGGLVIENDGSLLNSTSSVNATVNRQISGNNWHLISAPVSDAVSEMFTGKYLQKHTESTNVFTDITSTTEELTPVNGYALWGDASGFTATYSGPLNAGELSYRTTYSGSDKGWNLVGNPYSSSIDWNAGTGWIKSAVTNAIYLHVDNATWASYVNGVGTNGGSRFIAPGQGFFILTTNSGTLGMNDAVRVHHTTEFFKNSTEVIANMVRLEISGNNYKDEAVVRFIEEATAEFDSEYDAQKLFGDVAEAPQIYSKGSSELAINSMPEAQSVQIGIHAGVDGIYTIALTEVRDLVEVTLEDTKTGIYTDLLRNSYSFNFTNDENEQRLVLHFGSLAINESGNTLANMYSYKKTVHIDLNMSEQGDIQIYNISGQLVAKVLSASGRNSIDLIETGNYIVKVITDKSTMVRKVFIK